MPECHKCQSNINYVCRNVMLYKKFEHKSKRQPPGLLRHLMMKLFTDEFKCCTTRGKRNITSLNRKTMDAILCKLSLYYRRHGKICWAKCLPIVVFVETFSHCLDQKCWLYSTIKERGAYIHGKTFMDSWKLQKPRKFSPANLSIFTAFKLLCLMTYNLNDLHMCI